MSSSSKYVLSGAMVRRMSKTHVEKTAPQTCPMTFGGFPVNSLMAPYLFKFDAAMKTGGDS